MDNNIHTEMTIKAVKVSVTLGESEAERASKQDIEFDAIVQYDRKPEICEADKGEFICYDKFCQELINYLKNNEFKYIEYMAEQLHHVAREYIDRTLKDNTKTYISIKIKKCNPPVDFSIGEFSFIYSDLPK